ncbi:MAG TPA: sigma-70 family RNA polymerase sigma factor, partial [Acidimicrobiales bacterium]|nr:sigma-70 family RNA polymerase sigma factor [Acidimicrobiales bacterium]
MAAVRESTKDRVAAVEPVVRRVLASKVYDAHRLDDLVQETLTRLASSRRDLDGETLVAYAIVSARNLLASDSARSSRRGELQHRLADTRQPEQPEALALAGEQQAALRVALASLSEAERRAVLAHEVEGVNTATIAAEDRSTPGAVAARLARTRAKLRVDYLVAYRRARLPSAECHGVLVAISAGDRRRQSNLGAPEHVLGCTTCAELAPTLLERRLPLAILVPAGTLGPVLHAVAQKSRSHPARTTAAVGTAAAVAVALMVMAQEPQRPPVAAPPAPTC